jgi:hypothetical protein
LCFCSVLLLRYRRRTPPAPRHHGRTRARPRLRAPRAARRRDRLQARCIAAAVVASGLLAMMDPAARSRNVLNERHRQGRRAGSGASPLHWRAPWWAPSRKPHPTRSTAARRGTPQRPGHPTPCLPPKPLKGWLRGSPVRRRVFSAGDGLAATKARESLRRRCGTRPNIETVSSCSLLRALITFWVCTQ